MLRKTSYLWILSYNIMKNKVPLYPRFSKLRKTGYCWTLSCNVVKNRVSVLRKTWKRQTLGYTALVAD